MASSCEAADWGIGFAGERVGSVTRFCGLLRRRRAASHNACRDCLLYKEGGLDASQWKLEGVSLNIEDEMGIHWFARITGSPDVGMCLADMIR